ncbi:glucokinase [Sulfitobacter sp.]|uniref:glucokinase n=1 Tax=Sulfitobacter sp. TaxID=1903071 RepID=UPI0030039CD8
MRLVADIGGTNSRLALSLSGVIQTNTIHTYPNSEWGSLYEIIADYLSRDWIVGPNAMVIAVAGPVQGTRAALTNRAWEVETERLIDTFGVASANLLNDLSALGHAVPHLSSDQLRVLSAGKPKTGGSSQSLVVGIGTGFNVSPVLEHAGTVICPAVEAGHLSMPTSISGMLQALGFAPDQFCTVEALFSGRGFVSFCSSLTHDRALEGAAIVSAYGTPAEAALTAAVDQYADLLGHLLRDLTLAYMPSAGIYFAGSVARAIMTMAPSVCIDVLRQPFSIQTVNDAPIWIIQDDLAALSGCAKFKIS